MSTQNVLFHIAFDADIDAYKVSGLYRCESLALEGFIHCCDKNQLAGVTARYYESVDNVQLMLLDPDKLDSALIRENTEGGSELFPHVYGPINQEAIQSIVPFGIRSIERQGLLE